MALRLSCRRMLLGLLVLSTLSPGFAFGAKGHPPQAQIRYDDGPIVEDGRFVLEGRTWPDPNHLRYSFRNLTADMTPLEIETAMANAFAQWALACPQLGFSRIADNGVAHDDPAGSPPGAGELRILFGPPSHGHPQVFGANTLAHAFFPPPNFTTAAGDVHFNDDFLWALSGAAGGGSPYDLGTVMLHELGHSLGLAHQPTSIDAVMNPIYAGPRGLSADDIAGIRALYCPASAGAATPIDLVFLIDLTGSFTDDLPILQAQIAPLLTSISSTFTNIRYGVASFRDFPFGTFGDPGDVVYRVEQGMTSSSASIQSAINGLSASGGFDLPEAQYEALHQVITSAGRDVDGNGSFGDPGDIAPMPIGLTAGRLPVIILLTDADFHDSDTEPDYPCAGCAAAGRTAVLAELAAQRARVFVMVSQDPPDLSSQQRGGPSRAAQPLDTAAQELADATGGGVLRVGTSSQLFTSAVITALRQVQDTQRSTVDIPTLSPLALFALLALLGAVGTLILRRRSMRST